MSQNNSLASNIKQVLMFLVFLGVAMFIGRQINTWLGTQAMEATGIEHISYQEALAQSAETGKPVLLKFSALWCGACRQLDKNVFTDDRVKQTVQTDYYYVRLDFDDQEDKSIFSRYGVSGFPVLLLVDAAGKVIQHIPTPKTPEQILRSLQ